MVIEDGILKQFDGDEAEVILPEGLRAIERFAFEGRETVARVVVPDSVTEIGYGAFTGCAALREVRLPAALGVLAGSLFSGCALLEELDIPEGVAEIEDFALHDCAALRRVRLPEGLRYIGSYAFCRCAALEAITFPDTLRGFGHNAFMDCAALEELDIPGGVSFLPSYAFANCTGLRRVRFRPAQGFRSLMGIDRFAFDDCAALETVEAPASLRQIGYRAFGSCFRLNTIVHGGRRYRTDAPNGPEPVREIIRSIERPRAKPPKRVSTGRPFPALYPYMDEFEYLGRDEDE